MFCLVTIVNGYQKIDGITNDDEFGNAISISGDRMIVGASRVSNSIGAVYTYQLSGSTWVEDVGSPLAGTGVGANDRYGDFVHVDGSLLVVGAFNDESATGRIHTFELIGGVWTEDSASPHIPTGLVTNDNFGSTGAISGNLMVIGAWGTPNGSVFTYKRVGSNWVQETGQTLTGDGALDRFGEAISLDGNTLVVGARFEDSQAVDSGAVYTFIWTGGTTWVEDAAFLNPVGLVFEDEFGKWVSVSGDRMAATVFRKDGTFTDSGAVYTYTRSGAAWVQGTTLILDGVDYEYFGTSVKIDGDVLVAGVPGYGGDGLRRGAVAWYNWVGNDWVFDSLYSPTADLINNDEFGLYIALDGNILASSAASPFVTTHPGSVYSYIATTSPTKSPTTPTPQPTNAPSTSPTTSPSASPSTSPTKSPTESPISPTPQPTDAPSVSPTTSPSTAPSTSPSVSPTTSGQVPPGNTPAPTPPPTIASTEGDVNPDIISDAIVKLAAQNMTAKNEIMQTFLAQVNGGFPQNTSSYNITKVITEISPGTLNLELISAVGNQTRLEEAVKAVRYGSLQQYATIEFEGRRMLSDGRRLDITVPFEMTFEVSEELYALVDGIEFDDDAFEQALADELGINLNITDITLGSGTDVITVVATMTAVPDGINPLTTALIDSTYVLQNVMETFLINLVGGVGNVYVVNTNVDLCPEDRTCYYNGECNSDTGVCLCVGDWWGINCETPCVCINDGECVHAYCVCEYPWHGLRCHEEAGCFDEICPTDPPAPTAAPTLGPVDSADCCEVDPFQGCVCCNCLEPGQNPL